MAALLFLEILKVKLLFIKNSSKAGAIIRKNFPELIIENYIIQLEKHRNNWLIKPQKFILPDIRAND